MGNLDEDLRRDVNFIERIEDLEGLVSLLKLPRFELNNPKNLKPGGIGNSAFEKAKMEFFPYYLFGIYNKRDHFPIEKTIYSLGIVKYKNKNENFDYLVFAPSKDNNGVEIPYNNIDDQNVRCLELKNILKYKPILRYYL